MLYWIHRSRPCLYYLESRLSHKGSRRQEIKDGGAWPVFYLVSNICLVENPSVRGRFCRFVVNQFGCLCGLHKSPEPFDSDCGVHLHLRIF